MLKCTTNRETLIHRASEQAEFARWMETALLLLQAILSNHVKIGSVTGIEVFDSAGALVKEARVPSRQPGNMKSWVGS